MDELANLELAKIAQDANKPKRSRGRPFGARNYSGISLIARTMKEGGISWVHELIDAYMIYKEQLKAGGTPDPSLLYFWQEILPYITVKMIEKETRRERPKHVSKRRISHAALEALTKAEARKPA
jgi:hypothetical protein